MAEPEIHDILELIKSRRSITKYLPRPVEWEHISRIIDAGRHAPSCGNLQNWKFIVVLELGTRKAIAEAAIQQYWMITAPVHIIVCADPEKAERYYGIRGERLYTVQNCAAAVENMLLEAQSLGLGTCWIGAFDEDMVKRAINAEDFVRPQAIITIGYAAEVPPKPPKYPMNSLTYFERWRGRIRDPARYMHDYALVWQREIGKGKEALKAAGEKIKEKIKEVLKKTTAQETEQQETPDVEKGPED